MSNSRKSFFVTLLVTLFTVSCIFSVCNEVFAFERKVLFEDFTSSTCPPCASAAAAVEAGLENAGDDVVSSIGIHVGWPGAGDDPWWLDNERDTNYRRGYYGVNGVPTFLIDGTVYAGARSEVAIANAIRARQEDESPLQIEMNAVIINGVLIVSGEITAEADVDGSMLYVSLVEDYYHYRHPGGTNQEDWYDAMVRMLPDGRGTAFEIEDEQTLEFEFELDMDGVGWHELEVGNLIVVVWVQDRGSREVYQSQNYFFPAVQIQDWEIVDAENGNDDGRAEPGETVDFIVNIANGENRGDIGNLTVVFGCEDEQIEILSSSFDIEMLEGGQSVNNADDPFQFSVDEGLIPHPVTFSVEILNEDQAVLTGSEMTFTVGWPEVLIVDAASNANATRFMMEFFDTEEIPFADRFDKAEEGLMIDNIMVNYDLVIWHSDNVAAGIIEDWEMDLIAEYLDIVEGTFVLSSPGFIRNNGDSRLLRDYFNASLDNEDTGENWIQGTQRAQYFGDANIFAGGSAGRCTGFPDFTPSIEVLQGGEEVLTWGGEDENAGTAGVTSEIGDSRALLLAFPIESIQSDVGFMDSDNRESFMERIMNWYNGGAFVSPDDRQMPEQFSISAAFPNPFNSQMRVSFNVRDSAPVNLGLYNIQGMLVNTLVKGNLNAGRHFALINASENEMSSGVYYLRLSQSGNTIGQKVLYLK